MSGIPISVKAIVFSGSTVLFLRNPRGEWELPGGRPDDGESLEAALAREMLEECGLLISDTIYCSSASAEIVPEVQVLLVFFACKINHTDIVISFEHSALSWISLTEARPDTVPLYYWVECQNAWQARNRNSQVLQIRDTDNLEEERAGLDYPLLTGSDDEKRLAITSAIYNGNSLAFLSRFAQSSQHILEVGCGHGQIAQALALAYPENNILGMDASPSQIEFAKRNNPLPNLNFIVGDILDPKLPSLFDNKFDMLYCRFTLLHVHDRPKAISALFNLLNVGGLLLFEEPSLSSLFVVPELAAFREANDAILTYGAKMGVKYNAIDDIWSSIDHDKMEIVSIEFRQPTVWDPSHKELVLLSFEQFVPKLISAGIVSSAEADIISMSLKTEFISPRYVTGALRTMQLALRLKRPSERKQVVDKSI